MKDLIKIYVYLKCGFLIIGQVYASVLPPVQISRRSAAVAQMPEVSLPALDSRTLALKEISAEEAKTYASLWTNFIYQLSISSTHTIPFTEVLKYFVSSPSDSQTNLLIYSQQGAIKKAQGLARFSVNPSHIYLDLLVTHPGNRLLVHCGETSIRHRPIEGVGKILINYLKEMAFEQGKILVVIAPTERQTDFYIKQGFFNYGKPAEIDGIYYSTMSRESLLVFVPKTFGPPTVD